jgi:uncharacterized protein (TIGR00369 family)
MTPATGTDLMHQFLPASPFVRALDLQLEQIGDGTARLRMPFDEERTTYGDVVHGGAIAALVDTAVMVTAWAGAPLPDQMRGATVSLSLEYVDGGRGEDLVASGRVLRRGRTLCFCEVDVTGEDGRTVAKALATYKIG